MPSRIENGNSSGGAKFAFEGGEKPLIYDVLERLGEDPTTIMGSSGRNAISWIGTHIDVPAFTKESVLKAGGTGCFQQRINGDTQLVFLKGGKVVLEMPGSKNISPDQERLNI